MINPTDIATGLLGLGVIAAAPIVIAIGGRDRTADQHDLSDYRPGLHPSRRDWPLLNPAPRRPDVLTPVRRSAYAETATALGLWPVDAAAVVAVVAARYGATPAERAARFLAEIAAEQRAGVAR